MKRTTTLAILIGILCACATLKISDPMKAFNEASRAYGHAISWSEFVVAATFLEDDLKEKAEARIEHLGNFKVTAYEPRTFSVVEEDVRVRQVVKISYFRKDILIVKTLADEQLWEYDPEKGTWQILSGLPQFK